MSNTDFDPTESPIDFGARRAAALVSTSVDDDPEKAARAIQIADSAGANPGAVYENLKNFEAQHKAKLASGIVQNNQFLQDYVNSHPLAAKVSNDDYGQLDVISQAVQKSRADSILVQGAKGFAEGFGEGGLGSWISQKDKDEHPLLAAEYSVLGSPLEGFLRFGSGAITAIMRSAEAGARQMGADTDAARKYADQAISAAGDPGLWASMGPLAEAAGQPFMMAAHNAALREAAVIEPYAKAGKVPPVGVSEVIDAAHMEQAHIDADNLSEALKESVKSSTRERAPELFTRYLEGITDGNIGISADAVHELYGDKVPSPDNGLLGFIPDLAAQLERAEATGGDIQVPLASWLGKVEPDVAKELEDHIRARPEGMTLEETKEHEPPQGGSPNPVESVRQAAGLRPDQAFTLQKAGESSGQFHTYDILGADGQQKATLDLFHSTDGKTVNVEMLTAREGVGAIGKKGLTSIAEQIANEFPEAEKLDYHHISGAKGEKPVGEIGKTSIDLKKIREKAAGKEAPTEPAEKEAFSKASAIGMTVDQYKRYQALIEKRAGEDAKAADARAVADQRKRQTAEWKTNRAELRPQVKDEIMSRPEVELDEMLREGKIKLNLEGLDDAQAKLLPKEYLSDDGIHLDDLAGLFGDQSGVGLVDRLVSLTKGRDDAGMKPGPHLSRLIDIETDRQMEAKYGSLDRNILEEAKDQVLSETQEDLLHEETLARATEAGLEFSIGKEGYKAALKGFFDRSLVRDVSSDGGLAEAGRAGRATEMALLKGDYAEAFRQKQRQYNATVMANYARKFEKTQAQFEKLAKRFSSREVAGVEQEYTNWVHDILGRVGSPVKRSVQDLAENIARSEQKTLADFVDFKELHDMREVPVAEFLQDPAFKKQAENLTTAEFAAMHDSIKALAKNGRDEMKIIKAGEEYDLAQTKAEMIAELATFKEKHYDAAGGRPLGPLPASVARPIRTYLVSHLQLESIFNRWDRGDPRGVFTQFVARELATAANSEAALERGFATKLRGLADKADLKERIPNTLFNDPLGGNPITMTRKNLRAILLNAGNDSNLTKLARGYAGAVAKGEEGKAQIEGFKQQIMGWLHEHATKEDWDWGQGIWDTFAGIKKQSDTMYRSLTGGVEPESIPVRPIETPHGTFDGGYYPVIYHPVWEGASKKLMGGDALEQANYNRATTPAGYTKARTGYAAPLALDLDMMPVRMRQMIHDIAFRPSVIQAGKIFYDHEVRAAITKHYGAEYTKMLVPYLRDVANAANYRNDVQQVFTRFSEHVRQNIIATLIGLNPGTVLKHGPTAAVNSMTEVGMVPFLKAMKGLFSINEGTGETNWAYAMKTSEELQRRQRFYRETLGGATEEIQGETSLRDSIIALGAHPVAMSDLLSATPTWMAQYSKEMAEHGVQGDAVFAADRAVRRAHGSSVITNRPQVMRTGPMGSWLASLYGFFNHIMNRQYEMAWKAGDTLDLVKQGEYAKAMAEVPKLSGMLFSYVIAPAVIEELVTPLADQDKKESWGKKAAKSLAYSVSASWIGVRDIVSAMVNGRDPSIGLLSTAYKTVTDTVRDLEKDRPFSKQHAGSLIRHSATTLGAATGLMNAQVGKSGEFVYDYANGLAKPKGPWGWMVGLRYGTLKNHSQTFDQYLKGR